ncbi:MAG: 2-C-methyl-D-erythritol 2,4-cyclodiphosphate synthase [Planctomycetes bacterium]|jgi:2-C-methyl-D-erythritol 4-phosphate cytidylyltransferase/2-C-methyl-D-erythritol 2,4-cyclodiphosphate synthase|nr:2-C-methyl-D-erythritol 2,4-cyclodiphosphate synthase [Planctomycetota bacterium]
MALGVIVAAGGAGTRFGGEKILVPVRGVPLLFRTLRRLRRLDGTAEMVLVLPAERAGAIRGEYAAEFAALGVSAVVAGGRFREESVQNGFAALRPDADPVLVHDAVRPLFSLDAARRAVAVAVREGAAVVGVPARDTLLRTDSDLAVLEPVPREEVWHAETPQVFRRAVLAAALAKAGTDGFLAVATDEASLVRHAGGRVTMVRGEAWNLKVTERADLAIVSALAAAEAAEDGMTRIGHGWDVHRLAPGRPLMVGGVALPADRGTLGHSDGDALLHALTDAVLGAAGLDDIGTHFPDTDPRYRGVASASFVAAAVRLAAERGLRVSNADLTVVLEKPRVGPHRDAIRRSVAAALGVSPDRVNVKAKTAEGLGPVGSGDAVEAFAVVQLER